MIQEPRYNSDPVVFQRTKKKRPWITIALVVVSFLLGVVFDQVLNRTGVQVIDGPRTGIFDSVYQIMKDKWYWGKDSENLETDLIDAALNGMVDGQGDIHTDYMTAEEVNDFWGSLENSLVGVGISYQYFNNRVFVREVLEGSPAESYGILAGDVITHVDGTSLKGLTLDDISDMVTGEEGTKVVLTVFRNGETFDVTVVRGTIYTSVTSKMIEDGIGYVELSSFSDGTTKELKGHLDKLMNQGAKKLIVDLRGNGGGYLNTLQGVASFFLDKGSVILRESFRDGREEIIQASSGRYAFEDVVLLVDEGSASCTEVFAAALREHNGTPIVGTVTYGKGTVQVTEVFGDGSALKYTEAEWLTSSGESINGVGVKPDYEVDLDPALYLSTSIMDMEEGASYSLDTTSPQIASAQEILKYLKYGDIRIDGYFDQTTLNALHQFQKDNGLDQQDTIDVDMLSALFGAMYHAYDSKPLEFDAQLIKAMEVIRG